MKLRDERGIGVLVTDHSVRETLEITDRAYIIADGMIKLSGTPDELFASEKARELYFGDRFIYGRQGNANTERQ